MCEALVPLHVRLAACRRCQEAGYQAAAPPIFSGPAPARLLLLGQAPGRIENEQTGRPFSGPAGKRLFRWLAEAGWDEEQFRAINYITAVTKCYPGSNANGRGDRLPSKGEQALCRPWLEEELALARPEVVVPVGGLAISRLLDGDVRLDQLVGQVVERPAAEARLTTWARRHLPPATRIVPLPHPSGASQWFNDPANQRLLRRALQQLRDLAAG